jgi:Holliday junction resolvasome RuvABC endonuclease subunit
MKLVAYDLSLTGTGIAVLYTNTGQITVRTITPRSVGHPRLNTILDAVHETSLHADLAVIEGPSYGSTGAGQHERAGLWWLVAHEYLHSHAIPYAVVPPATRARYATGKGNASKTEVLAAAIRRYPNVDLRNDNEADALVLVAMAAHRYDHPLATVPKSHAAAIEAVSWPSLKPR